MVKERKHKKKSAIDGSNTSNEGFLTDRNGLIKFKDTKSTAVLKKEGSRAVLRKNESIVYTKGLGG
jgi:hypothetical protein